MTLKLHPKKSKLSVYADITQAIGHHCTVSCKGGRAQHCFFFFFFFREGRGGVRVHLLCLAWLYKLTAIITGHAVGWKAAVVSIAAMILCHQ